MASKTISALTDGAPVVDTDAFIIARSGVSKKVTAAEIRAYLELGLPYVLGAKATGWTRTGATGEANLAAIKIPANTLPVGAQVEVVTLWSMTSSANNKTITIRHNTSSGAVTGGTSIASLTFTTVASLQLYNRLANRLTNSQVMMFNQLTGFGTASSAPTTGAIDTTSDSYININANLANSGETIKLESYRILIIPPV